MDDGDRAVCIDRYSVHIPFTDTVFYGDSYFNICSFFYCIWIPMEEKQLADESMVDIDDRGSNCYGGSVVG